MKRTHLFYFLFFGVLLGACGTWQAQVVEPRYYTLDTLAADSAILGLIAPYKAAVDSEMNVVIGQLPHDLLKNKPNGNLGFWMADALRNQAGLKTGKTVDIALINQGGIRRPYLNQGPVTKGMIYELMPFDNFLVVLELDGALLYQLFELACRRGGDPISGGQIRVKKDSLEIMINGKALVRRQKYLLATNDYMYGGGDGYEMMQKSFSMEYHGLVRLALIEEMENPHRWPFPDSTERRIIYE